MTPKEKAKELLEKMNVAYRPKGNGLPVDMHKSQVKRCALMAVDEMLNDYSYMQNVRNANSNQIHSRRVYWQEVKQEITNI